LPARYSTPWGEEIERRRFSVMTEICRNFPGYLAERAERYR